jgi:integrase
MSTLPVQSCDPFVLPMPLPSTLVIPERLVVARHAHLNGHFADDTWSWAPLIDNPSARLRATNWLVCPLSLREQVKLAAWSMANGRLRPTFVKERGKTIRTRLSALAMAGTVTAWISFAAWLDARGITTLAHCDTPVLYEYALELRERGIQRGSADKQLRALTRLWAFDQLSAQPAGIARPPWDEHGAGDYLPARRGYTGGENATEPVEEATMAALLCWAIRVVEDLSADILAAIAENERIAAAATTATATSEGKAALERFLTRHLAAATRIPSLRSKDGNIRLARAYIQGLTGASKGQLDAVARRYGLAELATEQAGPCPLAIPVTGLIEGRPWRMVMDYAETRSLARHLGTAAFLVASYLTGIRPHEALGMRAGCCPDPAADQGSGRPRHLIYSREYKTAVDEEGNHLEAGAIREVPWVAIAPVVCAIRQLERMVPDGALLFDSKVHDHVSRPRAGGALKTSAMHARIADFTAWANTEARRHGLDGETIPPDPLGPVTPSRLRRTLAWHIARRPGGLVALAIQYGHLRTGLTPLEVTGGYASRARGGIHELIDIETVLATAQTAAALREAFDSGGGISGPAARAALHAAAGTARFEGQQVKADYARKYLARDGQVLYDNPNALLICRYKSDQALCAREDLAGRSAPSLERCVPGCGNAVRTDRHAAGLRERADRLEAQAACAPGPIAERLRTAAARARTAADSHDHTKMTKTEAS